MLRKAILSLLFVSHLQDWVYPYFNFSSFTSKQRRGSSQLVAAGDGRDAGVARQPEAGFGERKRLG